MNSPRRTRSQTSKMKQDSMSSSAASLSSSAVSQPLRQADRNPQARTKTSAASLSSSADCQPRRQAERNPRARQETSATVDVQENLDRFVEDEIRQHMMLREAQPPEAGFVAEECASVTSGSVTSARGSRFKVTRRGRLDGAAAAEAAGGEAIDKKNLQMLADGLKSPVPKDMLMGTSKEISLQATNRPAVGELRHVSPSFHRRPAKDTRPSSARQPSCAAAKRQKVEARDKLGPAIKRPKGNTYLVGKLKHVTRCDSESSAASASD